MADVVLRLHLSHILSFLGLTTDLSKVAPTCKGWAKTVSLLFEKRDVVLDCFSNETKYFDFRLQKWFEVQVASTCSTQHPLAILVIDGVVTVIDTCDLLIKQFDYEKRSWIEKPALSEEHPPMLDQFSSATYGDWIYIVGGHHVSDNSPSSAVWRYSLHSQVWAECGPLPITFVVCSSAVLLDSNGHPCLTVIGTTVREGKQVNEGYFKPVSDIFLGANWQTIASAPAIVMRLSSRSVVISQHCLVIGMWMRPHKFTLIEFNLAKNTWGEPFPIPDNYYIFPAAVNKQIVAMAVDLTNRLVTLRYNQNAWQLKTHPPEALNKFSLIIGVPHGSIADR